jgi:DNA-binding CsgD family transcriptional regulator
MDVFRSLLERLGLWRSTNPHRYALDGDLYQTLGTLAEQQQRSADEMVSDLLGEALTHRQLDKDLWRRWLTLSPREQQVTALTCLDFTNPQIAARLGLAVETVRSHSRNAQIKFNVNSKAALRVLLAGWDFTDWYNRI